MEPLFATLIELVYVILDLFKWLLIVSVILSWLVVFNVINTRSRVVYVIGDFVARVTEPVLRPLRSVLPNMGGIDLSAMVALLGIWFLQSLLIRYAMALY